MPLPVASTTAVPWSRADLHVHPAGDRYFSGEPLRFLETLAVSGLRLACLTDHDRLDVAGDLIARAQDIDLPVELVLGAEIASADGHLLGLGLSAPVTPGRPLGETIAAVHDQGGLAVVSHPLLPSAISASGRLLANLAQGPAARRPDGLEALNPMAAWLPGYVRHVTRFAGRHGYALTGGSDGHRPTDVGRGVTHFAGESFEDLREQLGLGLTHGSGRPYGPRDVAIGLYAQARDLGTLLTRVIASR